MLFSTCSVQLLSISKKRSIFLALICVHFFIAFLSSQLSFACEGLSVQVLPVELNYFSRMSQQVRVTISRMDKNACDYYITFSAGNTGQAQARKLSLNENKIPYQIFRTPNLDSNQILLDDKSPLTANNILHGHFNAHEKGIQTKNFYMSLLRQRHDIENHILPFGTYVDDIAVSIHNGSLNDNLDHSSQNRKSSDSFFQFPIRLEVPKMIDFAIVKSGQSPNVHRLHEVIEFGDLHTGKFKDLDLRVYANTNYSIEFASDNSGVLRHSSKLAHSVIEYRMKVNGIDYSLKHGSVAIARGQGPTQDSGKSNKVRVQIGDTKNKLAGTYSDVIRVTIRTTD